MEGAHIVAGRGPEPSEVEITGLTADSRQARPGYLFAALAGTKARGTDFIGDALARGVAAVLVPRDFDCDSAFPSRAVPFVSDDNPRRRFALMAARFFGAQPETIAAVTGTNGKTSVAVFTRQIWERMGHRAACVGTLGLVAPGVERPGALTTPDPVALHQMLADLAGDGVDHLAMEASSHGLDQYRLDGVRVRAAGFTNLSRDHLDYHRDMDSYLKAKMRLFGEIMTPPGAAVLNADVPEFERLASLCRSRGHRVIAYGRNGADLGFLSRTATPRGQRIEIQVQGRPFAADLPLVGGFQAMNALCALGLVIATGGDAEEAVAALGTLSGAPGRMQLVATTKNGASVFVDYAHTPDALENVLAALRPHAQERLIVVFGCGGDRDKGKRPLMGELAARLADLAVVTDDNPRTENAAHIRREVLAGMVGSAGKVREIGDRGQAIRTAVAELGPGDLLVVAGKGHERGQIVGSETLPFDDAEVARSAVSERGREAR
ncbi:MAG: UDP-N-acetylmuramoyl-L-alanyl-D-glutamate--2,6-diaminopimelate ligase [Alphaproteobacteria bacterium]